MAKPKKPSRVSSKLYVPLARGLAIAEPSQRPTQLAAGGPTIKILSNEGPAAFKLALWSVELVHELVPKAEQPELTKALAALHEVDALRDHLVATLPDREIRMGPGYRQISKAAGGLPEITGTSDPIVAAGAALGAFAHLPGGYWERSVEALGDAVEAVVRALGTTENDAVKRYLAELDRRVLVAEFAATLTSRSIKPPPITHVMWRGADAKELPAYWLVELEGGGELGLFCKLGARWILTTGTRDHVLATVPDTHLATALDHLAKTTGAR